MTHKENIKAQEDFAKYLNCEVIPSFNFDSLGKPESVKELLKAMSDKFREIYGADELSADMEFVLVPAVIKPEEHSELFAGIVQLDLTSSGEHYGTDFITQFGVINCVSDDLLAVHKKYLRLLHPYDYFPTIQYPGDIHVDWRKCPKEAWDIIDYCRGVEQNGGMELK